MTSLLPVRRRFLLAVALLLLAASLVARSAAAAGGASWSVATVANQLGAARPYFAYTLARGGRLEDGIVVANHGAAPIRLRLYAADAFTNDAGRLDLLARPDESTGVGAWVHAARNVVTVAAHRSVEVPFAVTVPDDAATGDHMGGIVAAMREPGSAVERRVGIRIRLRVGGALRPSLAVERLRVHYAGRANPLGKGSATIDYTIRNTGNAILAARQAVSVSGPVGRWQVRAGALADSPALLPGAGWTVSVPVDDVVPALRLDAKVTLVPLLADAAGSIAPLAATTTTAHAFAIPWALLLAAAAVASAVTLVAFGKTARAATGT